MKSKKSGKLHSDQSYENEKEDMISRRSNYSGKAKRNKKPSIYDEYEDDSVIDENFREYDDDDVDEDEDDLY